MILDMLQAAEILKEHFGEYSSIEVKNTSYGFDITIHAYSPTSKENYNVAPLYKSCIRFDSEQFDRLSDGKMQTMVFNVKFDGAITELKELMKDDELKSRT